MIDSNNNTIQPGMEQSQAPEQSAKRKIGGRISLSLALAAVVTLCGLGAFLVLRLRSGNLAGGQVRAALYGLLLAAGLSAASAVTSIVTFFLRNQRKNAAIAGMVLSLLVVGTSMACLYGYHFVFGGLNYDEHLNSLSGEELFAAGTNEDGEIVRGTVPVDATTPNDSTMPTEEAYEEIQWVDFTYDQIPAEARAYLDSEPPAKPCKLLAGSEQISMYMIFGLDAIESSDAMILIAVDRAHEKIKLISFARDTYACYPAWGPDGYTRLAYPYTYGGVQGELSTINLNFSLSIEDYVSANFEQLVDIIDYIGGVDVDINEKEYWKLCYRFDGIQRGKCHLNGEAALAYARIRNADNDRYFEGEVQRTGRQREVIAAIMEELRTMPLTEYPMFIRTCLGMVTTSLKQDEILDLALEVAQGNYTVESYALVDEIDHWQGTFGPLDYFYYVYDFNRASDWIYRTVYEEYYVSGYED